MTGEDFLENKKGGRKMLKALEPLQVKYRLYIGVTILSGSTSSSSSLWSINSLLNYTLVFLWGRLLGYDAVRHWLCFVLFSAVSLWFRGCLMAPQTTTVIITLIIIMLDVGLWRQGDDD